MLLSYCSKIIQQRMANKIDKEVSRLQSGFRPGTGAREGIFNLRTICERATDGQRDVYICFIDCTKAFYRVKNFKMIECLSENGIDDKDLKLIIKLYWEQSACVRTESGMTSEFKTNKLLRTITNFLIYTLINIQRGRRYERNKYWRSEYQQSKICR